MNLALILALIASGILHGLNPISGWPIALAGRPQGWRSCVTAMAPVVCGHLVGLGLLLMPLAALFSMMRWQNEIQLGAAALLAALSAILLVRLRRGHISRLSFGQMTGLSCFAAVAQGQAMMMITLMLFGLCGGELGMAAGAVINISAGGNMAIVLAAMLLHFMGMAVVGGAAVFTVTRFGFFRPALRSDGTSVTSLRHFVEKV